MGQDLSPRADPLLQGACARGTAGIPRKILGTGHERWHGQSAKGPFGSKALGPTQNDRHLRRICTGSCRDFLVHGSSFAPEGGLWRALTGLLRCSLRALLGLMGPSFWARAGEPQAGLKEVLESPPPRAPWLLCPARDRSGRGWLDSFPVFPCHGFYGKRRTYGQPEGKGLAKRDKLFVLGVDLWGFLVSRLSKPFCGASQKPCQSRVSRRAAPAPRSISELDSMLYRFCVSQCHLLFLTHGGGHDGRTTRAA